MFTAMSDLSTAVKEIKPYFNQDALKTLVFKCFGEKRFLGSSVHFKNIIIDWDRKKTLCPGLSRYNRRH